MIETEFPIKTVSEESVREKNSHSGAEISTLHTYWARRPMSASRTTTLAALLPDDAQRRTEWLKRVEQLAKREVVAHKSEAHRKLLQKARDLIRQTHGTPPRVLDPFAGGGSIPVEALRLGCEVHALDYNPLAVLLNIAMLQYPLRFGARLLDAVRRWGEWGYNAAREELAPFYPPDPDGSIPIGYFWARTLPCQNPTCGAEIPLIRQYWLANKEGREIALMPLPDPQTKRVEFAIVQRRNGGWHALDPKIEALPDFDPDQGTVRGAKVECPVCHGVIDDDTTRALFKAGKAGQRMVAVVLQHPQQRGKHYRLPTIADRQAYQDAQQALAPKRNALRQQWGIDPVPDEKMQRTGGNQVAVLHYGFCTWGDLFNPRQQLALITFAEKVRQAERAIREETGEPDFAKAVATYLALTFDRLASSSNMLTRWQSNYEKISDIFSRQAIPMLWDYIETNIFSGSTRSWERLHGEMIELLVNLCRIVGVQRTGDELWDWLAPDESAPSFGAPSPDPESLPMPHVEHGSATRLPYPDNHFDAVITDPPYYDNVYYSVLSDFFYVWLKRTIGHLYPDLFATPLTPKSEEMVMDRIRHANREEAKAWFEAQFLQAMREIHRVLKPEGIAVIVFAHKTTDAWETALNALIEAGLYPTASWPIHTEMKSRLLALGSSALASSIYLVCRKRTEHTVGDWGAVRREMEARIARRLSRFWDAGIRGADLFMSAIGPAMEVFGRYARVERPTGEAVTVARMLESVQEMVSQYVLQRILHGDAHATELDALSRFYLLYRWSYGHAEVPFDEARKLAMSVGVELTVVSGRGRLIEERGSGTESKKVRVLAPYERAWNLRSGDGRRRIHTTQASDQLSLLLEMEDKPDMAREAWDALKEQASQSLIDALQLACMLWDEGQKARLEQLLKEYGNRPAFWLLAQAISETLPKGDKEKQLLEGLLNSAQRI